MTLQGFSDYGEVVAYGVDSVDIPAARASCATSTSRVRSLPCRSARATSPGGPPRRQGCTGPPSVNIESFWDPDTGDPNLLEVNARHSQSHAAMFEMVNRASNHQAMLDLAFGRTFHLPHRDGRYGRATKRYLRRFQDGAVRSVPTREQVAALVREPPGTGIEIDEVRA